MTLAKEYLEDVKEQIDQLNTAQLKKAGIERSDLEKSDNIENIWYNYQKNITEYGVDDKEFAFDDAVKDVFGVSVLGLA
jgi:hypothetical protein